jgi:hypothetical protein
MHNANVAVLSLIACLGFTQGAAHAAETPCGRWEASVTSFAGEGEGLNAHLCMEAPAQVLYFESTCDTGILSIRFMPGDFDPSEDFANRKVKLDYIIDGKSHVVDTQFEELDSAFVADVKKTDPLVKALTTGKTLNLSMKQKKVFDYKATLKGSGTAFRKLLHDCGS